MTILLLTETVNSDATRSLIKAFQKRGHKVSIVSPSSLSLYVSNNQSGFDRTYRIEDGAVARILAKDFDVVYPRIGRNLKQGCLILDHLKNNLGIHCPISSEGLLLAADKFQTTQRCSKEGIRTPRTLICSDAAFADQLIQKLGGLPVILKQLNGSKGVGVSILESRMAARSTLQSFQKAGVTVLLQEYIDASGKDFRVFVVGGRVVAAYQRISPKGDFRANISGGGSGVKANITKEEELICLRAAQAIGLPVAGVDFMRSKSGEPFLIEVNGNPGFHVEKVTGISVSDAIVRFVEADFATHRRDFSKEQTKRRVNNGLMEELTIKAKKANRILDPILKDRYLSDLLLQYHGKTIHYTDRDGQRQERRLNSVRDLLFVMSQTFLIR